jgi:outer membrane protein OmpA-like peptidoglycan-associated protein
MFRNILILVFLQAGSMVFGQTLNIPEDAPKKAVKAYEKGRDYQKEKKYPEAIREFDEAIERYPEFTAAYLLKGSLLYQLKDFTQAEAVFTKVVNQLDDYPVKVHFTLGLIQYKLDKFSEALINFDRFLEAEDRNQDLIDKANQYRTYCEFAQEAVKTPLMFEPEALPATVNTPYNEYMPSITADGNRLIFSRREGGFEWLYEAKRVDGEWQEAEPLEMINSVMEGGAHAISADGRLLVFTSCERMDGYGSCDLYYSRYKRGRWTSPRNMGGAINSAAWESQPSLADNGRTIYFSSNRKGTLGRKDIWVSRRRSDGKWSKPRNLGPDINTESDDKAPFIHFDGSHLYFMSSGHPGMGDFDLYMSERINDTTWTRPRNLGYPLNTKFQEGTMIVSLDGKTGYITSDRHHHEALNKGLHQGVETDLYSFPMPASIAPDPSTFLEIEVVDAMTGEPIMAEVVLGSNEETFSFPVQEDGYELICVPVGKNYSLQVHHPDYVFHSERIELSDVKEAVEPYKFRVELNKTEAPEEEAVVLKNVLFQTGSAILKDEAKNELDFLSQWLKDHPEARIEVRGHTDNVGSPEDNMVLSQDRAQSVVHELIKRGIDNSRLVARGYGETQPVTDNDTVEGRALNRRTEFIIVNQ